MTKPTGTYHHHVPADDARSRLAVRVEFHNVVDAGDLERRVNQWTARRDLCTRLAEEREALLLASQDLNQVGERGCGSSEQRLDLRQHRYEHHIACGCIACRCAVLAHRVAEVARDLFQCSVHDLPASRDGEVRVGASPAEGSASAAGDAADAGGSP